MEAKDFDTPSLKFLKKSVYDKRVQAYEDSIAEAKNRILEALQAEPVASKDYAIHDGPHSAMSLARVLRMSPAAVQEILDNMVNTGIVRRVGDAYSYEKPADAVDAVGAVV